MTFVSRPVGDSWRAAIIMATYASLGKNPMKKFFNYNNVVSLRH